jgi:hypothetical protein
MGEALPELVGEADWRPASRAMLDERLRVRGDAGYHLHLSRWVTMCTCFIESHRVVSQKALLAQG